jgi:large subunit ribosomal protein L28e
MVAIPDQLTWELVKKQNCFLNKKSGRTVRSGTVSFSSEKGNLKSLSMLKFSGIANSKVIDIVCTKDNRAQLITKNASKAGNNPKKTKAVSNMKKDFRRSVAVITKQTDDIFYRRDLKATALAKHTKVYQANRRAKGTIKPVAVKKGRGTN